VPRLREWLLDPHASMREAARFYLRARGETDFAAFYRERVREGADGELAAAVAGVGETGVRADAEIVRAFLGHKKARVRKAAVRAVARLDAEGCAEALLARLNDEAPGVVAAARDALLARPHLLKAGRLGAAFEAAKGVAARRAVVALAAELPWWDGVPLLFEAAGDESEAVRAAALGRIDRWRRNPCLLAARPTREQFVRFGAAFGQHRQRLDAKIVRDVEAILSFALREFMSGQ
jgi:HEAT repeat protein